jgi:hypothetical protein
MNYVKGGNYFHCRDCRVNISSNKVAIAERHVGTMKHDRNAWSREQDVQIKQLTQRLIKLHDEMVRRDDVRWR